MKKPTYIIAEAGVNHNGSLKIAKQMIDVAAKSGVDAIKFQTFKADNLVSVNSKKAKYQIKNTNKEETQYEMLKKLELGVESHLILMDYCKEKNIPFLSTPFDLDSIQLLHKLGLETYKIASGEITNLPYLRAIGKLKKNVILSTGMSNLNEIGDALNILTKSGTNKENIIVLHANTEYPTPMQDVNLFAMNTIASTFNVKVGYSDHTLGIEVPIAAVAMGACVIEKHFTLDRNMLGPDHKASLEPDEIKAMVKAIRNIELAMGNGIKQASKSETKNIKIARKSIHAKCNISVGDLFSNDNLITKRPGDGISPMQWDKIIGKIASKNFEIDELIKI